VSRADAVVNDKPLRGTDGNGVAVAILMATFERPKPHLDISDFEIV
jgi:hypothetical protein